ncbi:XRE family transcriptional regulator, partial [Enterobacter hormaechei subsp. hoffmannii]|nr:XRE family transcriptional regulator [Enterobacter hormaechei subsp. hoffmannii]
FSVLGVEIVLSSREPLSDAKPEYGALHNDSSLPARREKW